MARIVTLLMSALLCLGLLTASADAKWTLKGRGFGHGVGLSQYGAYGYAEQGGAHEAILNHYFPGTRLGSAAEQRVRVLLGTSARLAFSGSDQACGESLDRARQHFLVPSGAGVELHASDGNRLARCGAEASSGGERVTIGGFGDYRGRLVARNQNGSLLVINSVSLDDYVRGVVANEMPPSWPAEALRAQAVVARSYALATRRAGSFDHYDDTRSQVYGGRDSETAPTNDAVEHTSLGVVMHDGRPAETYFFSTSGGRTESSEFGFAGGRALPYLRSVKDPFDDLSPYNRWRVKLSNREMAAELSGLYSGRLRKIKVLDRGDSPRIVRARIVGSAGSSVVTGDSLAYRLGLRSTWVKFKR